MGDPEESPEKHGLREGGAGLDPGTNGISHKLGVNFPARHQSLYLSISLGHCEDQINVLSASEEQIQYKYIKAVTKPS